MNIISNLELNNNNNDLFKMRKTMKLPPVNISIYEYLSIKKYKKYKKN